MKARTETQLATDGGPASVGAPAASDRWALRPGTWEDTEALVGEEFHAAVGVDPVNAVDIRRRLEVLAWDCPLHTDEAVARRYGHPTIVAPDTMVLTWCLPAYWSPGDPRPTAGEPRLMPAYPYPRIPAPGTAMFALGCKLTFFARAYPGDVIRSRSVLKSVTRKRLSVGDGAFLVVVTEYSKTSGELVAEEEMTLFRYTPDATDGNGA